MLKQISRLEKTRNTILLLFVVLMAVSLIIFYAPSRTQPNETLARSTETVAQVGSDYITVGDVATEQENFARRYAQFGGSATYTPPAKSVLDGEISERLIRQEAARLGFSATDEEVATEIRQQLKAGGVKTDDFKNYERLVTENFGSVEKFEQQTRDSIAAQKLQAYLTAGVQVSEDEVLEDFRRSNSSFELVYVPVTAETVASKLNLSDEELRAYFEKNKALYRIDAPQKKIRYLFINQAKVGEKLDIPEADLKAEYDSLAPDKKQKGVHVRQIVVRAATPESDAKALEKANGIVANARRNGATISADDFARLARENSEDPATATKGGEVAGLVRPNPSKPDDPYQQALPLSPGQITEPIKFGNAYYIIWRGEAEPKSFEDAKQELLVSLRNRRAYKSAADLAQKAADRLKEVKDVRRVADEFAPQANMKPEEMVRETDYVKPGDDVPNVGVSPQFEEGIAPLNDQGAVGERTQIKDGFAIPMLVDKRDPRDATFEEVKDKVTAAAKLDIAKERIEQIAKDLAGNANSIDALKTAAEKLGLKPADAKEYKLGSPLGEAAISATSPALDDAIYNLKPGEVTKTPIKAGENWFIVGQVSRKDASMEEFAKQRDTLFQTALETKKNQVFTDYMADLRQRMEQEGRIKIYKDALAKLDTKPEIPS